MEEFAEKKEEKIVTPEKVGTTAALVTVATVDPVDARLKELGVAEELIPKIKALGVETLEDLDYLNAERLSTVGMQPIKADKLLEALGKLKPAAAAVANSPAAPTFNAMSLDAILPAALSDESWLTALKVGGISKVDTSTVISAIRAALAHKAGLYEIPDKLIVLMEAFAEQAEEPVPRDYFKVRKQITKRTYAEIFEAIDDLDSTYVTKERKKALLGKLDRYLWPAIIEFNNRLVAWQDAWMKTTLNPAFFMGQMGAAMSHTGAMPSAALTPPDVSPLRDAAEAVANAINKVFSGTGVPIASALAYDALNIKQTLMNDGLPAMIGAPNRDQMLRMLDAAVPATYPRMEINVTRYVLAIMQIKDVPSGNEGLQYFNALYGLGSQIAWDQVTGPLAKGPTGIGDNGKKAGNKIF